MDGGCGVGPALQQGSLCSRYVWGGRMRAAAFGEGGPPWDVPCGVRKKPGVGRGRKGGGGSLWGCGCWRFHICSRCYLPANASGRRSVAVLVCGCSRLPALWFRGGGDAAVPASGWGGVTTRPAPLPHCRTPCAPPPPLVVPPQPPGLHAPHPHCAARFCCTLGAACCDAPPALLPPQPAISRGGDACGHVRGVAECHRPPLSQVGQRRPTRGLCVIPFRGLRAPEPPPPPPLAAHLQLQCRGAAEQQRAPPPPHRSGDGQRGMGWVAVGTSWGGESGRELLGYPEGPLPAEGVSALPHIAPPPPRPRWARPDGPALIS